MIDATVPDEDSTPLSFHERHDNDRNAGGPQTIPTTRGDIGSLFFGAKLIKTR
ncbi:hypothetical protein [Rhizobium sp.]|uniref:hypothetical protein n=1 Tax=Rhizobium sp. TaxID=391 RepID=UPI0028AED2AD